ncbi:MAG: TPM domain-containing protein [Burkholderiales bacterium]|nr:TPM domain-containing protein [Burkholderiales bacterium]
MDPNRLLRHTFTGAGAVRSAFPGSALDAIERAIGDAEARHSGQIRFAVEAALAPVEVWRGVTGRDRALQVFAHLGVWDTEHNNGVLIYLLLADHDVEIVADRGIHLRCGGTTWEKICHDMEAAFRRGEFEAGVLTGIAAVGRQLEQHFPRRDGAATNELPDRPIVL